MDDDSRSLIHDLKKEWKLFWSNLSNDGFKPEKKKASSALFPESISHDQIQEVIRNLSRQRHEIHQKLEVIQKDVLELERNIAESNEPSKAALEKLGKLNDMGHKWSEALNLISEQLKLARAKEVELSKLEQSQTLANGATVVGR